MKLVGLTEKQLVIILASLSALTPLAIDMYLPAIKGMEQIFNASSEEISKSISIFFLGMAFGQIFGGPVSDAYGRRSVIIAGLTVFALTSIMIAFTTSVSSLYFLRFLQAFGGGITTVNIAALVRDYFSGRDVARILSLIGSVSILAPLLAPAFGLGILFLFDDFRFIFLTLFLYSLVSLFFYKKYFKTSIIEPREKTKITPIKNYTKILTSLKPMLLILAIVISSSGNYCVISSSPFVYPKYFGLSEFWYVVCFSLNIAFLLIMVRINIRLVKFHSPAKLLIFGMIMQTVFGLVLLVLNKSANIYLIAPLIACYIGMQGFIFGNGISIILDKFVSISASANAVIGSLQYGIGALSGYIANNYSDGTLFPFTLILFCTAFIGSIFSIVSFRLKNNAKAV